MKRLEVPRGVVSFCLLCGLWLVVGACSSGGGGGGGVPAAGGSGETGSVAILVTDGPTDEFSEVQVTIQRIELLSDGGRVEIFRDDDGKTIDLLKLEGESSLFSLSSDVAVGRYQKIRLHVTKVLLVKKDGDGNVDEEIVAKLPANGKIDLNPQGGFTVSVGVTIIIQIDIDAKNSIHIVRAGRSGQVLFRPQVFVRILTARLDGKLVRLQGIVDDFDPISGTFRLCPERTSFLSAGDKKKGDDDDDDDDDSATTRRTSRFTSGRPGDEDDRCVTVFLQDDTSIFDARAELVTPDDLMDGDKVTVVGHLSFRNSDGVEETLNYYRDESFDHRLVLDAAVIEIWADPTNPPFRTYAGTIESEVDADDQFDFEIAPDQGIDGDTTVKGEIIDGTKIFDRTGKEISGDDLGPGQKAMIDGLLVLSQSGPDVLRAPLIVVDSEIVPREEKLEGTIVEIDPETESFIIELEASPSDGGGLEPAVEVCVELAEDADIFLLMVEEDGFDSEKVGFDALELRMNVDVFGRFADDDEFSCFIASDVLTSAVMVPEPDPGPEPQG